MSRLILSVIENETELARRIERDLRMDVIRAREPAAVRAALAAEGVAGLLRLSGESPVRDLAYAREVRQLGFGHPLVLLTEPMADGLVRVPGVTLIERSTELDDVISLVRKAISGSQLPQQVFRRYAVNLSAQLEPFITGEAIETTMLNLSRGGAYCETGSRPDVDVGDLLRLRVSLDDIDRVHTVSGRVVWMTDEGKRTGGYGLGLKFMMPSELFRGI